MSNTITVSNTLECQSSLMCPNSLESTLVQISVVDMLRLYNAALGRALYSNLEMGCCLLDIYPISFLFHKFTYPCRMLYFFRYKVILHLSVSIQEKTERTQKGNKILFNISCYLYAPVQYNGVDGEDM